jgi:23S rRNA (guanosine2251-2'-O)-methyltransferase
MQTNRHIFYECDNPACRLRFPGYEGYPKSQRCPECRSSIHVVATSEELIESDKGYSEKNSCHVEVMLDNIRSAWNVGSIFRTADGCGIKRLYLCGITPTPENSKVRRTSLGAEQAIKWTRLKNGVILAQELKTHGYALWAMEDLPGAIPLYQNKIDNQSSPIVIILGNEVAGIDPGIIEICDKVISIPMLGKKRSYNVAVAFGIAAGYLLYFQSVSQGSRKILPNT